MKLFNVIDIETSSYCNRRCATCLRNSWPDRNAVRVMFDQQFMPVDVYSQLLRQCADLDFRGRICLCHWNEPLLDPRLPDLARMAAAYRRWILSLSTNGDALTEELASRLDGVLDQISISVYSDIVDKTDWFMSLFKKTQVRIKGLHRVAHHNPRGIPLVDRPCRQAPRRCIVAHNGQYLYCCEDLTGQFRFGYFPQISLRAYWFGDRHVKMWDGLRQSRGRHKYPYCMTCPWAFERAEPGSPVAVYTRP